MEEGAELRETGRHRQASRLVKAKSSGVSVGVALSAASSVMKDNERNLGRVRHSASGERD